MAMSGLTGQCEFILPIERGGERRFKREKVKDQAREIKRERDVHGRSEIDARCEIWRHTMWMFVCV